jgi:hypothetical protein
MGKYKGHMEFGANAPINWRERTTSEVYLKGMTAIAPPGMKPRERRGQRFEAGTDKPESAKWHRNYDLAMFEGSDIAGPDSEVSQTKLEDLIQRGEIERIPQVKPR